MYLDMEESNDLEDSDIFDENKPKWFNSLQISVFVRDPTVYRDDIVKMHDLKNKIKAKVPGYDFEAFHMETVHNDEQCISGDIFAH